MICISILSTNLSCQTLKRQRRGLKGFSWDDFSINQDHFHSSFFHLATLRSFSPIWQPCDGFTICEYRICQCLNYPLLSVPFPSAENCSANLEHQILLVKWNFIAGYFSPKSHFLSSSFNFSIRENSNAEWYLFDQIRSRLGRICWQFFS